MPADYNLIEASEYAVEYGDRQRNIPNVVSVDLAKESFEQAEHENGDQTHPVELQGRGELGTVTIERDVTGDERMLWNNLDACGESGDNSEQLNPLRITLYDGNEAAWEYKYEDAWVMEYKGPTLDSTKTSTATETFTFQVSDVTRIRKW